MTRWSSKATSADYSSWATLVFSRFTSTWVHVVLFILFVFVMVTLFISRLALSTEQKVLAEIQNMVFSSKNETEINVSALTNSRLAMVLSEIISHPQNFEKNDLSSSFIMEVGLRRFVRSMISFLPVLGFVGTVLGIMTALGALPEQLSGDISALSQNTGDSAALADGLQNSLSGIAIAFETTLLGLVGSLVASFVLAWIEKTEMETVTKFAAVVDHVKLNPVNFGKNGA